MIKASNDLQDLRRRLYVKAKSETSWRFWGLKERAGLTFSAR
jgi:RNA-directed DNA polymerase